MPDDEITRRLDTIVAILRIAHEDAIDRTREEMRKDKTYKAILELASDWTAAGKLQTDVVRKSGQSARTFRTKVSELVDRGIIERRGGGPTTSYRVTGLV